MDISNSLSILRNNSSLNEAIKTSNDAVIFICFLLRYLGFITSKTVKNTDGIQIFVGHTKDTLFSNESAVFIKDNTLSGLYSSLLDQVFLISKFIDKRGSSLMLLPNELRHKEIDVFLEYNNISSEIYSLVLKNMNNTPVKT